MTNRFTGVHRRALALMAAACCAAPTHALADQGAPGRTGIAVQAPAPRPSSPLAVPRSQAGITFYARHFGVDELAVRYTASGSLLEFRYRVIDPAKARILGDAKAAPELVYQKTGVHLSVPEVEQVGTLRQMGSLQAGRVYWVMFPNPGKSIKPGDRVDINIGASFRVSGLVVEQGTSILR